ncbi:phage tail tape measure protein [Flavobacterium sp. TR2]|uniref:phage tail tape measure protein n=1 Tax=Flavobacterium sp. TR2 TaxID=2977321 RepID=UPI0021B0B4BA|nr:phage tail tape measure protein [Flavobacterium sp. TR2]UWY28801.1 phage tail tape measure protein [Flavobacterium sp. TR2]
MDSINYNLNFQSNGGQIFATINGGLASVQENTTRTTKVFGDCYKALLAVKLASEGIQQLGQILDEVVQPGIELNTQMADLGAITGLTGQGLKDIEMAARQSSKVFGTDASNNVNAYKLILSQLSPEIAQNSEAMKLMGDNVNILSKTMGGDTVAATNVLTTAMNQYGVNLEDPIAASKVMADMMNVMAAGAKEGSAELPQIQAALEQVGMVAKTTGISFVTTNAAIQMLDKAGKKGSEGGVALRNVLTTLSEGRFASKDATEGLQAMGISTLKLSDASIPLTDRLRMLRPVMSDTALMTKVFGKENMAAGIALIETADAQDELALKITGTNTAVEQANTIMGSYQERMNRINAVFTDWRISIFNATQAYLPYLQTSVKVFTTAGKIAESYTALKSVISAFLPKLFIKTVATQADTAVTAENAAVTGVGSIINRIYAATIGSITRATLSATIAQLGLNAAMLANPIGLIIVGVVALIAIFKMLWDNSKSFREVLFGIWEAAKAVFNNIGIIVQRVWNMIVKPIIMAYYNAYKFVFTKIWEFIKFVFNAIASIFVWYYETAVSIFTAVSDFVVGVFNWIAEKVGGVLTFIGSFFSGIWEWFSSTFSGFVKFIDEWLVQPIISAFSGVWDWIVALFEKIMDKLTGVFAPIKKFFKTLFSSEGMTDVKAAYKEGEKKGAASYDKDHRKEKDKEKPVQEKKKDEKPIFDVTKGFQAGVAPTKPIAGVGAKDKKEGGSGGGSGSRSINIGKLIENMTLHFHGTAKESKESIKQSVTEALLTAVNDVNLAQ